MDDPATNDIEARLATLRMSILERPAPGLDEARRRFRSRRRRPVQIAVFVAGVAVLVAALVVDGVNPAGRSTPAHPSPGSALSQKIDNFAEQGAARAGDPDITEVRWVATNRKAAEALLGDDIVSTKPAYLSTVPVYLIEVPGYFSPNVSAPSRCSGGVHGTVADYVISRSTFQVFEGGVAYQFADLSKLGAVHVDHLRSGPLFPSTTTTTSPTGGVCAQQQKLASFVALAQKGADGTFSAIYDVPAQPESVASTVRVAHLAPAGSESPTSGSWMFEVDRVASGDEYLWVSRPHSTAFCTNYNALKWSCEQTSLTIPQGNGWSLAAAYYLPLTELYGIEQYGPDSTTSRQVVDGLPVDCLADKVASNGATLRWCITSSGVLASFSAVPPQDGPEFGGSPADATVTEVSSSVPASLFTLPSAPGAYTGLQVPPSH
jgi:hypothetical protein